MRQLGLGHDEIAADDHRVAERRGSGPGTDLVAGDGHLGSASPDCGHTCTTSSAGQPGGAFTATATITWDVTWHGAGVTVGFPGTAAYRAPHLAAGADYRPCGNRG
jgi:hypothetical protein